MKERRKRNRRQKMARNLFSYFNRRDLFRKGRRKDEWRYQQEPDWFEKEDNKGK